MDSEGNLSTKNTTLNTYGKGFFALFSQNEQAHPDAPGARGPADPGDVFRLSPIVPGQRRR